MVGASTEYQHLLGFRLVAVDAVDVETAIERLRPFIPAGETEGFVRAAMVDLLRNPDALAAAGIVDRPSIGLTVEADDGHRKTWEMKASSDPRRWIMHNGGAPLWSRNQDQGFWTQALADGSIYVNWRSYGKLSEQTAALLKDLEARRPRRLIVDLRDNNGGDYNVGRAFIEEIRKRVWLNKPGALYVLIGRTTFSAAMTNAIDFRKMTHAVLVGEPAGAAPNNWQEVRRFHLPNSGLQVGVSTVYYSFLPGEALVRPDLKVPPEPRDWGAAQDAAVRAILSQP